MLKKILITGGAVHAHLDDVKIITNKFKGGLMADLADKMQALGFDVTYLTSKMSVQPKNPSISVVFHEGYFDYREKVLRLAPSHQGAIIGAAVANLIPANPWKGKFPSHNYNEGDTVSIDFLVTPRVISEIKKVAPNIALVGYKLLSGAPHDELMKAAWHTLISSKAVAVIANDATDLNHKYVVTKEGGVHEQFGNEELALFLKNILDVTYYRTVVEDTPGSDVDYSPLEALINKVKKSNPDFFVEKDPYIFGTAAYRQPIGFLTTGRGKQELTEFAYVQNVDHTNKVVYSKGGKATLNAPLLDWIFSKHPGVVAILHGHHCNPHFNTFPYAIPGTAEDTFRPITGSFNIQGHGCFVLSTQEDLT